MRIAMTGAHGVGKTTVLKLLQPKLPDYKLEIESLTRKAVKDSSKVNFGTVDESEILITDTYMNAFLNAPLNYIGTRHLIDVLAYSEYLNKKNHNISPQTFDYIEEKLFEIQEKKIFDKVLYIPIEFKLVEKGDFRQGQEDLTYQRDIDTIIKYLLWKYDIKYEIISGSPEQRVKQILNIIKGGSNEN